MSSTVLMSVEGVLSDRDEAPLIGAGKVDQGVSLFHAFHSQFNVVLSTLEPDEERAVSWLRQVAGIQPHQWARLVRATDDEADDGDAVAVRRRHLIEARAQNYDIRYFVDPNPRVALSCLATGVTPMCCPHPVYARESFLPDSRSGGLSWEAIQDRVLGDRASLIRDPRLQVNDIAEEDEEEELL
jgi:hypothetical protein